MCYCDSELPCLKDECRHWKYGIGCMIEHNDKVKRQ